MNTQLIIAFAVIIIICCIISYFIGLANGRKRLLDDARDLFKFIINTEHLTTAGKINLGYGILLVLIASILALPLTFIIIYQALFGHVIFSFDFISEIIKYFTYCAIPISLIESLIYCVDKYIFKR